MSCRACEEFKQSDQTSGFRWGNANLEVRGCPEHLGEVFEVLRRAQEPIPPATIDIQSVVSAQTGEGQVQLRWGREGGHLDPTEALQHALRLVEAAAHATVDAFLWRFLREKLGADEAHAAAVLREFRAYCLRREPENWRKPEDHP